jgi:quercetin dioxygenase-like cupin family protein
LAETAPNGATFRLRNGVSDLETAGSRDVERTALPSKKFHDLQSAPSPTIVSRRVIFNSAAMTPDNMHIFRSASSAAKPADPNTFVGSATSQRLAEDGTGVPVGVYRVAFAEGARTNWHTHSGPQWLFVVEGRIRVRRQGEAAQDLTEGDAVVFAPGEKHWHGAVPGTMGTHLAVNVDLKTTWLEAVSASEYEAVEG